MKYGVWSMGVWIVGIYVCDTVGRRSAVGGQWSVVSEWSVGGHSPTETIIMRGKKKKE